MRPDGITRRAELRVLETVVKMLEITDPRGSARARIAERYLRELIHDLYRMGAVLPAPVPIELEELLASVIPATPKRSQTLGFLLFVAVRGIGDPFFH